MRVASAIQTTPRVSSAGCRYAPFILIRSPNGGGAIRPGPMLASWYGALPSWFRPPTKPPSSPHVGAKPYVCVCGAVQESRPIQRRTMSFAEAQ